MKLVNVRFSGEDERMLAAVQRRGIVISELLRDAVRTAFHQSQTPAKASASDLLQQLDALYPVPASAPDRPDATQRRKVAAHIRAKLSRHKKP